VLSLGQHVAELLGVPAVVGLAMPALVPTREFPAAVWPCRIPAMLNRPSYLAAGRLVGTWCRRDIDRWRRDVLDLPPRRLAAFLDAGRPVVYVGFGSMPSLDAARLAASVMTAAEDNDVRVVVASLDPALRRLLPSGRFLVIRNAPHDWLFRRVDAIVHHGGAGTTAAALYAGKPQVIWSFSFDQPFWGRRMASLGVAPEARPVHELTGPALTSALDHALGDPGLARRSAALATMLRAEDGVGTAVSHLEEVMTGSRVAVGA
jgi:UDP:flavonoid glycosyltransferase YjiC (YdhE family)